MLEHMRLETDTSTKHGVAFAPLFQATKSGGHECIIVSPTFQKKWGTPKSQVNNYLSFLSSLLTITYSVTSFFFSSFKASGWEGTNLGTPQSRPQGRDELGLMSV